MRAGFLTATLVTAFAAAPAGADAQTTFAQDLGVEGAVVAAPSTTERTVRFTVTNHGPGTFNGFTQMTVRVDPEVAYLRNQGSCAMSPSDYATATCYPAVSAQGASQGIDIVAGFRGTHGFDRDKVTATLTFVDPPNGQAADANAANNTATVDMGIVEPAPALALVTTIPGFLTHGAPSQFTYVVSNTGGQDLFDVRVTDSRCTGPQTIFAGSTTLVAGPYMPFLGIRCSYTPPDHHKGEARRLATTVTATGHTSTGTVVSATQTRTSVLTEPRRECGSFRVHLKGHPGRTRFKTFTTVADRRCRKVRRQLKACLLHDRHPPGFRCDMFGFSARLQALKLPDLMQADRA
jgi:hypothetical protein